MDHASYRSSPLFLFGPTLVGPSVATGHVLQNQRQVSILHPPVHQVHSASVGRILVGLFDAPAATEEDVLWWSGPLGGD